jgi:hypothetical protein
MNHIVPPSLLFDFQLSIPRCADPSPKTIGRLLSMPAGSQLFIPAAMNDLPRFADVSVAWNPDGLAVVISVKGKPMNPTGTSRDIKRSDVTLLWIDTRPAGNVHRATEYCHHFACLPVDEHQDNQPAVVVQPIAQQRTTRIDSSAKHIRTRTHLEKGGYDLEVWIPGTQLHGFREITEIGRIGFYCVVQDSNLGEQPLTLDDNFPTGYDPSMWVHLELTS